MKRSGKIAIAVVAVLVAACGELPTTAPSAVEVSRGENASVIVPGTCTTLNGLNALAAPLFGANTSPNISSVLSKLKSLDKDVKKGKFAEAEARANEIVAFTLKKYNQGGLSGTTADVEAFTNAVFCFAGIDLDVQPEGTFLILPSDFPQVVATQDGNAGIQFPANPVSEPTLVTIENVPGSTENFLDTKLDKYPGFIRITKLSATNAALTQPVVVGVCADGVIPQAVRDRLRLGHGKATGFEIAAPGNAGFLDCPNQVADAGNTPLWQRLASYVLPQRLHARAVFAGGGVGGTVTEFSPFGAVDPELSFGGGVGGTVTEFIGVPAPSSTKNILTPSIVVDPCATGTAGEPLPGECVPSIRVTTFLGTELANVPVIWDVTAGGGTIAPKTTVCGTYGATAATLTNATGRAGICWTLGAPGSNKVRATPSAGGDAPVGVVFTPANTEFEVTAVAGAPAALLYVQGTDQVATAGTAPALAPTVRVVDSHGYGVPGATVNWKVQSGDGTLSSATSVSGSGGFASVVWTFGVVGYQHAGAFMFVGPNNEGFTFANFDGVATPP